MIDSNMIDSDMIGKRIKKLRVAKNETQAYLAGKLSVKRETVNQWENGTRDLKTQYTVSLAEHFKTTCDYLLCVTDVETQDIDIRAISEKTGLSEKAIEQMEEYQKINGDESEKISRDTLNLILEDGNFYDMLFSIYAYHVTPIIRISGSYKKYKEVSEYVKAELDNSYVVINNEQKKQLDLFHIQNTFLKIVESLKIKKESDNNGNN